MNPIQSLSSQSIGSPLTLPGPMPGVETAPDGASFKNYLLDSIREVNAMQQSADRAVEQLATGGDISPAEVLTAVQKADIAFRMMMQIRNKLVQAYNEVKDIRV